MSKVVYADKKADYLNHDFIECLQGSGLGHVWVPAPDDGRLWRHYHNTARYRRKTRRCERCSGFKCAIWDRVTGDYIKPWAYRLPKGYHLAGRVSGHVLRKAYLELYPDE